MFDTGGPRVFSLPPGADFPAALVAGLRARLAGAPAEAMAAVTLIVNTQRMRRRIIDIMADEGAGFLPRIRLVTDLGRDLPFANLTAPVPPLRRRLELTRLIDALLAAQPDLAPRAAIFDLADSLADLMDEMRGEGVHPATIAALDVSQHSAHWRRTQEFLGIVAGYFDDTGAPDQETRQRMVVERLIAGWTAAPPENPVIVAGSTGSRGTTALLMRAVAGLPQGALVLPGFDGDMPPAIWNSMTDALAAEDHPQFRFHRLLHALDLRPEDVAAWHAVEPPDPARNRLISLSLRPAPVTDQWLNDGPDLGDLLAATAGMTLIEAPSPRIEATAIALVLREAAETGTRAALITPDRQLTRQVTAALDRWGILPDDSAGRPLALSAPGRFLRHVAQLFGKKLTAERLLELLKHPLAGTGGDRGRHLLFTRDLELQLRRHGPVFPVGRDLLAWAAGHHDPAAIAWAESIAQALSDTASANPRPLESHVARHRALAEALARGTGDATGELWRQPAGEAAMAAMDELAAEAPHGATMTPADYSDLFTSVLDRGEVRDLILTHPHLMIWGTLEARVQGADLVILGGLNDGTWPSLPDPDPWLNRDMRAKSGLLLPERQIGLAAHDYQQAVAAERVILSRARRDAAAETVASRWLNRLTNLIGGLPDQEGDQALARMRDRGAVWLAQAAALDAPQGALAMPARRPAPRPPVEDRPKELSVTNITKLIRDPYAVYARHILRLYPLNPLHPGPDALLRGQVLHLVLEKFARTDPGGRDPFAHLMATASEVLATEVPWPSTRALWQARLERAAGYFIRLEGQRDGKPVIIEEKGGVDLGDPPFRLTARPDRIDLLPDGRLHILDFKTGDPPTDKQQAQYDKQLLLEAAMARRGAFGPDLPREVARISYIGLGTTPKESTVEITDALLDEVWEDLRKLIQHYGRRATGYTSRRAMFKTRFESDYDHLARFGEWDMTDRAVPEDVGDRS